MPAVAPISQRIWDMKYRLKEADGSPVDGTIEDTWRRVADALAAHEDDPEHWRQRFLQAMTGFRLLPAGRIIAGAGSERSVTLFNCFVMGQIPDDMSGIFEHLKEAALTMQQGGGIGYDFSTLRPKGAAVRGVGADASGPLTFMDVWDAMCRTIMSAGHRRGAMMATLRCDHPDIEAFIEAKREAGRLRMFNLSVLVTDHFMAAVDNDESWELSFGGTVYKSLPARELWDRIMRATYANAEPGVIFIDRINRLNNLHYAESISATNPCVTGDTWVTTSVGPRQVSDLVSQTFEALIDGQRYLAGAPGFFSTGRKPVLRIDTQEGPSLRLTANHRVRTVTRPTRYRQEFAWKPAGELRAGDRVALHDHRSVDDWPGRYSEDEGYLMGLLVGDGTLKKDKAVISVWPGRAVVNGSVERPGALDVMNAALVAAKPMAKRSDFRGWMEVPGRGEYRLALARIKALAGELGMAPGDKRLTPDLERTSSAFHRGFLRGFFDADGTVVGDQKKGLSVRLAQSDLSRLEVTQRMLLRFGIAARIYRDRRPAGSKEMPDGKGGSRAYDFAAQHELVIANDNVQRFARCIGFCDGDKARRLQTAIAAYRREPNRGHFTVRVDTVVEDGIEEVFDVSIPGANAFDANGLFVHNCGEQPLPPYGACLLGSINFAALVSDPFEAEATLDEVALEDCARVAVRLLDNAIEVSNFPLPEQEHEARMKRRIGLGFTGLADALIMCGARYGSDRAVRLTERWVSKLSRAAYLASTELAAEKGPFPLFEPGPYLAGENIQRLDAEVRSAIEQHGMRNALVTSVAPTGTISLFADNVSSGLEPVFSFSYSRAVTLPDGSRREEQVSAYSYRLFRQLKGETAALTDAFVDAQELRPEDHVRMQAAVQAHIDSAVSKTINLPEEISFENFKDVYSLAYRSGCKGCTTYRPNEVTGAVLAPAGTESDSDQPELPLSVPQGSQTLTPPAPDSLDQSVVYMTKPLDRPDVLEGNTYKVRWPETDHAIYITINDVVRDSRRRPFEVFINSKNTEHYAWTVGLTRMISAVFRRGGDISFVVDELKAVFDPRGGQWVGGRYVPSLLAAIGEVIEEHLIAIGFIRGAEPEIEPESQQQRLAVGDHAADQRFRQCPRCGQASLMRLEGCDTCTACAYSRCG